MATFRAVDFWLAALFVRGYSMKIDLKDSSFTLENVRALLAAKDDSQTRRLRISETRFPTSSDRYPSPSGVKARFETCGPENDYCGPNAAADGQYVQVIYDDLQAVWQRGLRGLIDYDPRYD
jgi:hypothetical protein